MIPKCVLENEYNGGKTYAEIAKSLNCKVDMVKYYAKKYGIKSRRSGRRRADVCGKHFGSLSVKSEFDGPGKLKYVCVCDCGEEIIVSASSLLHGQCSCWECRNRIISNKNWKGHGEISGNFWDRLKRSAVSRKISMEISIEEAWDLFLSQQRRCALTGVDLKFSRNKLSETTASLDRIDSSGTYIIGNTQWVHKNINVMKWELSQEEFVKWCNLVVTHQIVS